MSVRTLYEQLDQATKAYASGGAPDYLAGRIRLLIVKMRAELDTCERKLDECEEEARKRIEPLKEINDG